MKKPDTKKLLTIVGRILTILSVVFVIYALSKLRLEISEIQNIPLVILVSLPLICLAAFSLLLPAASWVRVAVFFSGSRNRSFFRKGLTAYCKANPGKYLPGNVMHYVERNLFLKSAELSQLELAVCSVSEIIGQVLSALLLGLIFSFQKLKEMLQRYFSLPIFLIVLLVLAVILIVLFRSKKIRKILSRLKDPAFLKIFFTNLIFYAAFLLLQALTLLLLCGTLNTGVFASAEWGTILMAYVLSWLIGFLVPGAPGGIGVRELSLSFLVAFSSYYDTIMLAAVIHRAVSILGDFLCYLFALLAENKQKKEMLP